MNKRKGLILASISFTFMFGCMVNAATFKQTEAEANKVKIEWNVNGVTDVQISPDVTVDDTDFTYQVPRGKKEYTFDRLGSNDLASATSYFARIKQNNVWSDVVEISTAPDSKEMLDTAKQVAADKKGVTIEWGEAYGATEYLVYISSGNLSTNFKKIASVTTTSTKIKIDKKTSFRIVPARRLTTGYLVIDNKKRGVNLSGVKPLPGRVKKNKQVETISFSGNDIKVEWQKMDDVDGFQFQYCKYNNKGKKNRFLSGYQHTETIKNNKLSIMKFKVRAYILIGDKKVYGAWSKERVVGPDITRVALTVTQIDAWSHPEADLKWKKVKGVKKYEVYMSTAYDKGYKKIKTTKKNKLHVSSFNGSQMKFVVQYYFKIVGVGKVNKKTYRTLNKAYKGFLMNRLGRG